MSEEQQHDRAPSAGADPAPGDAATGPSASQQAPPSQGGAPQGDSTAGGAPRTLSPERGGRDNMDLLKSLFLGVLVTALFYEVFPIPFLDQGRILQLFDNNISELIVAVTCWSLFLLVFKAVNHRAQRRGRALFDLPGVRALIGEGIYARDVETLVRRIDGQLAEAGVTHPERYIIYRRVFRVLQYIRSVPKKEGINDLLDYQSQIDLKKQESAYTLLHVFIWAIPILGFIGTVMGIGAAVSEFSVFIQTAEAGVSFGPQMRAALGGVTSGLAVAFNTTFLALVLVIPVMVLTSILNKNEEALLLDIEEFCLEDLLPHLHITPASAIQESYEEHLHRIIQLSNTWLGEFEPLVKNLGAQTEMLAHQIGGVQPLIQEFTDQVSGNSDRDEPPAGSGSTAAAETPPDGSRKG